MNTMTPITDVKLIHAKQHAFALAHFLALEPFFSRFAPLFPVLGEHAVFLVSDSVMGTSRAIRERAKYRISTLNSMILLN